MEHVEIGTLRIGFRRAGSGPALLLLHGAVSDSRVWRIVFDTLAEQYTVVAWDAPGCGQSTDPPELFRMADFGDCLAAFVDHLELDEAHVLGHSWGSTLALDCCRRHPSLVRSVILVGGYAGWAGSLPRSEVAQRLRFALAAADSIDANEWEPRSMPGLFSDLMQPEQAEELSRIMSEIRAPGTRTMAHALAEADLRPFLGDISTPTLILAGDRDERSPLNVAQDLHRAIPNSRLTVLQGLGHECYLEDPVAFTKAVRAFLDTFDNTGPATAH
jgi:pimeloyl-ACP methyl ester carboxylesterase